MSDNDPPQEGQCGWDSLLAWDDDDDHVARRGMMMIMSLGLG